MNYLITSLCALAALIVTGAFCTIARHGGAAADDSKGE